MELRLTFIVENPYTLAVNAIVGCSSLTSLSLEHCPPRHSREVEMFPFLEALCEFFELAEVPLPALERLTLEMADRDGDMMSAQPHVCTRLARALLSQGRYPRFRAVVVNIQPRKLSPRSGMWLRVQAQELLEEDKQACLDRWRAAFSTFHEHPEVSLQVNVTCDH